jgi:hypothetical protein
MENHRSLTLTNRCRAAPIGMFSPEYRFSLASTRPGATGSSRAQDKTARGFAAPLVMFRRS